MDIERPSFEPPENDVVTAAGNANPVSSMSTGAKRVSIMATGASPNDTGLHATMEYVCKELAVSQIQPEEFKLVPNETNYGLQTNNIWLQPEGEEESLCQNCDEGHSHITPCSDGGQHSSLSQQMASALAASSRYPNVPLKWSSCASQVRATQDVQESQVLAPPVYRMDRWARKAACSSITVKKCVPARDVNMYSCLYEDSD